MSVTGSGHDIHALGGPPGEVPGGALPSTDVSGEVLTAAHGQARLRAEAGDLTGARTLLEDALASGELQYGRDHPQLAPLMVDLATIARNVGNLTEAQHQLRRAYGIVVAAAGPEHATALSIEGRLAAVNYRLGEPTEAYDWHIANVGARILGSEHPAVRGAQQRLAAHPVHEEQTPPTEPPAPWPQSYAGTGFAGAPDDDGGWAPGYAGFTAAPTDLSMYGIPSTPPGVYVTEPPPMRYPNIDVYPEPPLVNVRRGIRGHASGVALVTSFGLAIILAAAVIAYQLFGAHGASSGAVAGQQTSPPAVAGPVTTPAAASPTSSSPPQSTASASATPPGGSAIPGAGLPPAQVTLHDDGGSVTLTWVDPSGGQVPFIVTGGRVGEPPGPMATVPSGRTTQTIYGLNIRYNYCFTVAAVWSADLIEPSDQTCTKRASTASPA